MKDRIIETPIVPDSSQPEHNFDPGQHYAVLGLPEEYGDQAEMQAKAVVWLKHQDFQNTYDGYWDAVPLEGLATDAIEAVGGNVDLEPLIRYYAAVAKGWGFSDQAQLDVSFQSDKNKNPNAEVHRDGLGAKANIAFKDGKTVRCVRFVYPIGRPGTIIYPELDHVGNPVDWEFEVIESPTEADHLSLPHLMAVEGVEKQRLLDEAGAFQLLPGATLVFDMTSSPWHVAPALTPDGAVMTVNVFESW